MGWILLFLLAVAVLVFWMWIERWHLLLPSTIPALKWMGIRRVLSPESVNAIFYGRWIETYLKFLSRFFMNNPRRAKWLEETYHGKVLTPELAKAVINCDREIPLQDLGEKIIPYSRARDIVLSASKDIVLTSCGCKTRSDHSCKKVAPPYRTCMLIGSPLTDYLLEHKPLHSQRISQAEALTRLSEFHEMGLVHNAFFKDCLKDQFYVICNCCECCCLGFESMRHGIRQLAPSGYACVVDPEKCTACGKCVTRCMFGASTLDGKAAVSWEKCMGCGVCVSTCPSGARSLVLDEKKGLPMDVRKLA